MKHDLKKQREMEYFASSVAENGLIEYLIDEIANFIYEKYDYDIEDSTQIAAIAVSENISKMLDTDFYETFDTIWENYQMQYIDSL